MLRYLHIHRHLVGEEVAAESRVCDPVSLLDHLPHGGHLVVVQQPGRGVTSAQVLLSVNSAAEISIPDVFYLKN